MRGIPEDGSLLESRLEQVIWEVAVKGGFSVPDSVNFAYDKETKLPRGFGLVEFPHVDVGKQFLEATKREGEDLNYILEVDGHNLTMRYYHKQSEASRSRSRGDRAEEVSPTIMLNGLGERVTDSMILGIFQPIATVRDIRLFAKRGFAFVEFHTIEEAQYAVKRFDQELRNKVDGQRVSVRYATERKDSRFGNVVERQAEQERKVEKHLEDLAKEQMKEENCNQALSGVNAGMWASYMQSLAQTETVESAQTFEFDKESGFYYDAKAELYYDPATTYFWTKDATPTYFVYNHEEEVLCQVDAEGQMVPDGQKRPLPSKMQQDREQRRRRERSVEKRRSRSKSRRRRSRSFERRRSRSPVRRERQDREQRDRRPEDRRPPDDRNGHKRRDEKPWFKEDQRQRPIYFPGGDPLAVLAPAPAPKAEAAAAKPVKKKKVQGDSVLGIASQPVNSIDVGVTSSFAPGPVQISRPGPVRVTGAPGPVTVVNQPMLAQPAPVQPLAFPPIPAASRQVQPRQLQAPAPQVAAPSQPQKGSDFICEICLRKFQSEEMLRKHEQFSDLHKQNLAKMQGGK